MARLRNGEKGWKENAVRSLLLRHRFGLYESEIACELGWQRRTVNNYLHALQRQGQVYKEKQLWFADR